MKKDKKTSVELLEEQLSEEKLSRALFRDITRAANPTVTEEELDFKCEVQFGKFFSIDDFASALATYLAEKYDDIYDPEARRFLDETKRVVSLLEEAAKDLVKEWQQTERRNV